MLSQVKIRKPKRIAPLIKMIGGDFYQQDWIRSCFPSNFKTLNYLELYGGAGSVIFNKENSRLDIWNDINPRLFNLFFCFKCHSDECLEKLNVINYTRENFEWAKSFEYKPLASDVEAAIAYLIKYRFSRGGLGKDFAWSTRTRGGQPGDKNAWENFKTSGIFFIIEKLRDINIYNAPALHILKIYNHEKTLCYLDPPFLPETRISKRMYEYEMDYEEHTHLINAIKNHKGQIILAGYDSELYNSLGWKKVIKEGPSNAGQTKKKKRKLDCLWLNY